MTVAKAEQVNDFNLLYCNWSLCDVRHRWRIARSTKKTQRTFSTLATKLKVNRKINGKIFREKKNSFVFLNTNSHRLFLRFYFLLPSAYANSSDTHSHVMWVCTRSKEKKTNYDERSNKKFKKQKHFVSVFPVTRIIYFLVMNYFKLNNS